jgi:hypothetical protein
MGGFVEGIENILEHLIVVLKAAEYGFDHVVDEERNASRQWESLTPNALESPTGRAGSLSRVEIWFRSTGTGLTTPGRLGVARRTSAAGRREVWTLQIPKDPVLVVEMFARGFDQMGKAVAEKAFPLKGPGPLYEALYGSTSR